MIYLLVKTTKATWRFIVTVVTVKALMRVYLFFVGGGFFFRSSSVECFITRMAEILFYFLRFMRLIIELQVEFTNSYDNWPSKVHLLRTFLDFGIRVFEKFGLLYHCLTNFNGAKCVHLLNVVNRLELIADLSTNSYGPLRTHTDESNPIESIYLYLLNAIECN